MARGHDTGGSVGQDSNNYDEPPRSTGNRMQTDFAQDPSVKENRYQIFKDRRRPK